MTNSAKSASNKKEKHPVYQGVFYLSGYRFYAYSTVFHDLSPKKCPVLNEMDHQQAERAFYKEKQEQQTCLCRRKNDRTMQKRGKATYAS